MLNATLLKASLLGVLTSPSVASEPNLGLATASGGDEITVAGNGAGMGSGEITTPPDVTEQESLYWTLTFERFGGIGGVSENNIEGDFCPGRQRSWSEAFRVDGNANCFVVGWVSEDPDDCRVIVHIGVPVFGWGKCVANVYVDG
jgi:hypothetical protein